MRRTRDSGWSFGLLHYHHCYRCLPNEASQRRTGNVRDYEEVSDGRDGGHTHVRACRMSLAPTLGANETSMGMLGSDVGEMTSAADRGFEPATGAYGTSMAERGFDATTSNALHGKSSIYASTPPLSEPVYDKVANATAVYDKVANATAVVYDTVV
jgi:hypothetical protein